MSPARKDLLVSIAALVLFAGLLLWSAYIPDPRGREFPLLVTSAAVVLCVLDVLAYTATPLGRSIALVLSGDAPRPAAGARYGLRPEAAAIAWIVAGTAAMVLAGFLAGIPIYVFGYMVLYAGRTIREGAIAAAATTVCTWVGFELLLDYELYRGALMPG
jgi:hypothetical protein